ncbi:unnamed protein product [Prunus armeniaca]|uniref:Uncharacterized protein n=1 Tax=Prunus armeniaca TaxID=36596 RepID=A0A6J5XIC5_PRUAR|nr:unnamed protein product [Prunus armeniaca]
MKNFLLDYWTGKLSKSITHLFDQVDMSGSYSWGYCIRLTIWKGILPMWEVPILGQPVGISESSSEITMDFAHIVYQGLSYFKGSASLFLGMILGLYLFRLPVRTISFNNTESIWLLPARTDL